MEDKATVTEKLASFQNAHAQIVREMSKVIIGQREVIDLMLASLFCGGHCLLIGVPGLEF
jgi:MoxR-like ATPase